MSNAVEFKLLAPYNQAAVLIGSFQTGKRYRCKKTNEDISLPQLSWKMEFISINSELGQKIKIGWIDG